MNWINKILTNVKKNLNKNKVGLIIFAIIWVIAIIATLNYYDSSLGKESIGNNDFDNAYEIYDEQSIIQVLPVEYESNNISIKYATFIRNNKGHIYVNVKGNDSNCVYLNTKTNVDFLQDNSFVTYTLNEALSKNKDKSITISLTSDSKKSTCGGVYYSVNNYFDGSLLKINGVIKTSELGIKFLIDNEKYSIFSNTVITFIIVTFSILILLLLLVDIKEEIMFSILIISFGLIFACIMSPGAIPDENDHYEKSLQVSNIMMFKQNNIIDKEYVNYDSFGSFVNASHSYNRFMRDMNKPLVLENETYMLQKREKDIFKDNYLGYYIPQAIGVTLARLLNVNMLRTYYSGRVFNLIFYTICIYIAIKNTPIHKLLFGIIALLPIFIQQAASFSYDAFINGLVFISISFFFKWYYSEKEISKKEIMFMIATNLLLAPAKIVYGFFAVLFCLVPNEKFGGKKKKIIALSLIILPTVIFILYSIWERLSVFLEDYLDTIKVYAKEFINYDINDKGYELNGGYTYSTTYILAHPIETLLIIFRTIRFWLSTWFYQSLGRALAGVTLILPMTFVRVILILIIISSLVKQNYCINNTIRIAFLIICIVVAMFILIGMLYGWTLTTDTMIQGVQGRYFCPLLPYFFSIINNKKVYLAKKIDKCIIFTYIVLMFEVMSYILSYTFVN